MSDPIDPKSSQEEPKDETPAEPKDPAEEPKDPAETPAEGGNEEDLEALPEWARKAISRANAEAASRRVEQRELQAKLEGAVSPEEHARIVQELKDSLAETSRTLLTNDVIRSFELPDDDDTREFLTATDEEGLKKQAEKLAKLLSRNAPKNDDPDPELPEPLEPRGGKDPFRDPEPDTADLRQTLNRKRRRF